MQYTVTGTAQPGKDFEPVTGTVLLPAGADDRRPIPILTLNTNVFFLPTDMIAGTWPTRVGQVFVKEGDIAPAGHAAVLAHRDRVHGDAQGERRRPHEAEGRPGRDGAAPGRRPRRRRA